MQSRTFFSHSSRKSIGRSPNATMLPRKGIGEGTSGGCCTKEELDVALCVSKGKLASTLQQ